MQYPVGEDMPAFGVITQLRLINRNERKFLLDRHRFNGAAIPPRLWRLDPLFAGDQSDLVGTLNCHHTVVNLPCQQTKRETNHPARMRAHPLNGEVGFAGIGRAENGRQRRSILEHSPQADVALAAKSFNVTLASASCSSGNDTPPVTSALPCT